MRKEQDPAAQVDRRGFLKRVGLAVGAAGAAAAASSQVAAAVPEEEAKSSGYRETEHVRTYYALARF